MNNMTITLVRIMILQIQGKQYSHQQTTGQKITEKY